MNWLVALFGFGCARLLCLHIHKQRPNIRKNSRPFGCCRLRIFVYLSPGLPIQAGGAALQYRARFSVGLRVSAGFVFCMSTDFPITLDTKVLSAFSLHRSLVHGVRWPVWKSARPACSLRLCLRPRPTVRKSTQATESARPSLCRICDCTAAFWLQALFVFGARNPARNASSQVGQRDPAFVSGRSVSRCRSDENRPIQKQAWATAVLAASLSLSLLARWFSASVTALSKQAASEAESAQLSLHVLHSVNSRQMETAISSPLWGGMPPVTENAASCMDSYFRGIGLAVQHEREVQNEIETENPMWIFQVTIARGAGLGDRSL